MSDAINPTDIPQIIGRVIVTKRGPRKLPRLSHQWSAEQETRLLVLYREGKKYSEIGQLVGKTKNAVCGKMKRLKDAGVILCEAAKARVAS